ncbi:MAG: hypothetical protein PUC87_05375, partial [Galactobacillus timonensis]|nr:hypothetical protein [Galactobacillus timonensis]
NRITFDNEEWVIKAMEAQGFVKNLEGLFEMPEAGVSMEIPPELIPKHPDDGSEVTMNLRADDSFVENDGWHAASAAYSDFLRRHEGQHILFLEIGVGANTPVIIKFVFHRLTRKNPRAFYACVNLGEAYVPDDIASRSVAINADAGRVLSALTQ